MTCGATSFISHVLPWSSALLSHLAVPVLPYQPNGKQHPQRKLFLGVEGPRRTRDWKLMHLKATYGFIMTFPNTSSISLGPNFWHLRAG